MKIHISWIVAIVVIVALATASGLSGLFLAANIAATRVEQRILEQQQEKYPEQVCPNGRVTQLNGMKLEVECNNGFTYVVTSYKYNMTITSKASE